MQVDVFDFIYGYPIKMIFADDDDELALGGLNRPKIRFPVTIKKEKPDLSMTCTHQTNSRAIVHNPFFICQVSIHKIPNKQNQITKSISIQKYNVRIKYKSGFTLMRPWS